MLLRALPVLTLLAALSAQNEVLYYKFEGGGTKALNYAANSPAPAEGPITNTLTTAPTASYNPGWFGTALTSGIAVSPYQGNYVATGWSPAVTGDYTWAMWLRNSRGSPGPSLTYVAGVPASGSFRIYGGSTTLLTVGGAGGTTYYRTIANIYSMATAGWVHVAFVVDTVAMTATYYVNGVPEAPLVLTALPNIVGPDFYIGRQTTTNAPSIYDLDEFRFLTRAASAAEVLSWSSTNLAGESAFGTACDASLRGTNGLPQLGNFAYGLAVASSAPNAVGVMTMGFSRTAAGAMPLPVDLGTFLAGMGGCGWECSADATLLLVLDPAGAGVLGFPVLPVPGYDGVEFFAQGLFVGGPRGVASTNPFAFVFGN
jgi:hypothetical protein